MNKSKIADSLGAAAAYAIASFIVIVPTLTAIIIVKSLWGWAF